MTLNGIDVADYQSGIGKVAGNFRIIKATEGTGYTNPALKAQVKTAPALLGFYHFASNGNYKKEADYFISRVKPYIGKAVLVLDYEPSRPSVSWAKNWLDYVYSKTGVRPLIYMGLAVENVYNWSTVAKDYGLWVSQYNNYNRVSGFKPRSIYGTVKHWKSTAMFQYTSSGRLSGWNANLDFDVFYGDKLVWAKYAAISGKASTSAVVNHTARAKVAAKVNVTYGLRQLNGQWLNPVKNFGRGANGFAGNPNHKHDFLYIRVNHGKVKYRVHTLKHGWLSWVTKGNRNDLANGCAGIAGDAIDGVKIVFLTPTGKPYQQAYYRSQTTRRAGWLGVVCDDGKSLPQYKDTYAGILGEPLDRLQINIGNSNPF